MVDNLLRLREPVAWIFLGVTAVSIVLAVVRFVLALTTGGATLSGAAQDVALEAMSLTLVITVVALVIASVFHAPVAGARRLVLAAATVVTLGTVLTVVGALLGLPASAGALAVVLEFLGGLLDIVLKIVGAVTLWLIHRGMTAGRIQVAAAADPDAVTAPEELAEPAPPAPTWTPDAAAGSVWTSASDAASGAEPSGWGVPGGGTGWHPVSRPALDAGEGDTGPEALPEGPADRP